MSRIWAVIGVLTLTLEACGQPTQGTNGTAGSTRTGRCARRAGTSRP
jgi:hypothetical protein